MDTLRSTAHLQREIGDELFGALVSSDNTDAVREFAKKLLVKDVMPTSFTAGNRTYDILSFLRGNEKSVVGHTMVERAKEMNANLGEDDGQYLLDNQQDIPVALRDKVVFVFTDWRLPGDSDGVYCVYWDGDRWVRNWNWLVVGWGDGGRVLRRK